MLLEISGEIAPEKTKRWSQSKKTPSCGWDWWWKHVSWIGKWILYHWANREIPRLIYCAIILDFFPLHFSLGAELNLSVSSPSFYNKEPRRYVKVPKYVKWIINECRSRLDPWVRKIHWRRKWKPTWEMLNPTVLAWEIPWSMKPGGKQYMRFQELDTWLSD